MPIMAVQMPSRQPKMVETPMPTTSGPSSVAKAANAFASVIAAAPALPWWSSRNALMAIRSAVPNKHPSPAASMVTGGAAFGAV